ncbi:MAG: 7-cyano-7-deazaguanine synthase QueC [bacterium]|nr:7-cyano-7-deazaguanine synthase QueC [bacterium]MDD5756904.1 7-cyano-7-deazaguanine synthase QueC [bacterium]
MNKKKTAVVLLSGGLDSATCLYWAKKQGFDCHCLIFDYGQRHKKEIQQAVKIAKINKSPFQVVKIFFPWKGSSLLDKSLTVPVATAVRRPPSAIPSTYVPARNTIFLSFALSFAEAIGARAIVIGANALDYSGYPDCRPGYFQAMQKMANLATKAGIEGKKIKILTPLLHKTKAQIIKLGTKLKVPYQLTWSCYRGGAKPCVICDSCILRAKGFREAKIADPAILDSR